MRSQKTGGLAIVTAAAVIAVGTMASGSAIAQSTGGQHDDNDVAGPIDLADVGFNQKQADVIFDFHNRGALPSFKELDPAPQRISSPNQRYICLQLQGNKIGRVLICPGGKVKGSSVNIGLSTYGQKGVTKLRKQFPGKLKIQGDDHASIRFSLDAAGLGAGKFQWRVISGWTGSECDSASPSAQQSLTRQPVAKANLCLDSVPDSSLINGKINKLVLSGCKTPSGVFSNGPRNKKAIALTFDDGPSSYTNSVMEILDRHNAKGTFFVVGSVIGENPDALKKMLVNGHEIGNHSYNHESLPGSSSMQSTNNRVEDVTGFTPCTFRPPYGALNSSVSGAARSLGMSTILWDIDTNDYTLPGSGSIYSSVVGGAQPGAIALMHDGGGNRSQTVSALEGIVTELQDRGYKLVTVTELLGGKFKLQEKGA